ncbi:MAG: hypothetical protein CUN54_02025 [Phototrophicales bacterium]|nr:MAG: hypothetical protein CUN54_02025 [Phototrophicales bacterium]
MSNPDSPNTPLENLLSAVTDALIAGDSNLDSIVNQYGVPRAEVNHLLWIIRRLHVTFVGVQPSEKFVRRLKQDLMGSRRRGIFYQIRHLPPRIQIVAGITLIIGLMFVQRRRTVADEVQESQEMAALQTHSQ